MSRSEDKGLSLIRTKYKRILSVGISTAGQAEIKMAAIAKDAVIIATTLDESGAELVEKNIKDNGLDTRVFVRVEDIAKVNPAHDGLLFDFVYARLVLHYLSKIDLKSALTNIYNAMQPEAILFAVVRSVHSFEAQQLANTFDETTGLTTYEVASKGAYATRYFHSQETISNALVDAQFKVESIDEYDEALSPNFDRGGTYVNNSLIEVIARKP